MKRLFFTPLLLLILVGLGYSTLSAASPQAESSATVDSPFTEVVAFATKTGYRGVFAWKATQVVDGEVHYGTDPNNLSSVAKAIPSLPDTAQLAVVDTLTVGETYYYKVVDNNTGAESEVGSFDAVNAWTSWDGSTYTINLLVQLDADSLDEDVPHDAALANIAAGINILAERNYDALDRYARIGKVIVTDTNLDYAANVPFQQPPVCEEGNRADFLIESTVPFDSHTYSGYAIERPCTMIYMGRIGQLVIPWQDDLHFGYVATHELMHYAFGTPDLYLGGADCRNLEWDGSLMHNSGGWAGGRWELTELDRNPTLTPCNHGDAPYSWDRVRNRYPEVPLNENGPIDHVVDTLPRGNADGEGLQIHILDRELEASTLTSYTPDDQAPECAPNLPQVVDAEGDANGFVIVDDTLVVPSEDSLDITKGFLTWDPDAEAVTFHIRVKDLKEEPPTGSDGYFFRFFFAFDNQSYQLTALKDLLGTNFTLRDGSNNTVISGLPGAFDVNQDEVSIVLPAAVFAEAVPSAAPIEENALFTSFEILAQRLAGVLTLTTDRAPGSCDYTVGQEILVGNQQPNAVDDAATTVENRPVVVNVLHNDSDPDGDPITVVSVSPAPNGAVKIKKDGAIQYRPDPGFVGTDSFTYTIEDGQGGADTATVTVEVSEK